VVSIYLDDCIVDHRLARQLRAAGHLLYLPKELGVNGQDDEPHLATAASLGAVLVTHNQQHFAPIHHRWATEGRSHAGIILAIQDVPIGTKLVSIDRAARLLTPAIARGHLMYLKMFATEELARLFILSLTSQ
jgi:hypothetical protein